MNQFVKTPTDDTTNTCAVDFMDSQGQCDDLPDFAKQALISNPIPLMDEEPPRSPKRQISNEQFDECPRSPKSPRNVPCMTDIGTLVRRVKNVKLVHYHMLAPETCV